MQLLNNQLERIAESAADKLVPAFEKLAPHLVTAADALGKFAVIVAENPLKSIGGLLAGSIAASVAKAAIGDAVGSALGKALGGMGGAGLAIGAITVTATMAYLYMKKTFDEGAEGQNKVGDVATAARAKNDILRDINAGRVTKEEGLKQLEETYASGSRVLDAAKKGGGYIDALNPFSKTTAEEAGMAQQLKAGDSGAKIGGRTETEALKENMVAVKASIDALKTQMAADALTTKKVHVVNQQGTGNPVVDPGTRTGS